MLIKETGKGFKGGFKGLVVFCFHNGFSC